VTAAGSTRVTDTPVAAADVLAAWLSRVEAALSSGDSDAVAALFTSDGYWRDILTFTWKYKTFAGPADIAAGLLATLEAVRPRSIRPAPERTAPRIVRRSARNLVEAYFDFDTEVGRATGFVRLHINDEAPLESKAWILLTALQELRGHEERTGDRRPTGIEYSQTFAGDNWLDQRAKRSRYLDRDPEVVIVGAGQSGLALAARLGQIGADVLVLERTERVGDGWRNRYHSLTLHNEVWANSLPYLPFPPTWPTFLPKDKLAGWLEAYAQTMELNVWTGTEFIGGTYDDAERRWTAQLRASDGSIRTVRTTHLVLATGGAAGAPHVPTLDGLDEFNGTVIHSSQFTSGTDYSGQRALVIGTGNSGHDVAQDLHANGAALVTMVQRSPTCVLSLVPSGTMIYALYSEHPAIEDIDLITVSIPFPVLKQTYQWITRKTCELDADLLFRLNAVGFETDFEPDLTGFYMRYLRRGGGYYVNVGCSDLIADGEIGLVQAREIARYTSAGFQSNDGKEHAYDLIVLATGYQNQQELVRQLLGDEVADRVGPIWGFDDENELRNMWRRTRQPGFWVMGGNLLDARMHSKFLALQIQADLLGIHRPQ
jgi:cation diffusion facilitator CzcD-associated flavoprotein CzcO